MSVLSGGEKLQGALPGHALKNERSLQVADSFLCRTLPRMASVLHLLGPDPDEQTRQIHSMLAREIGPGFTSETRTIDRGGTYRNLPGAVFRLRREKFDITYAWGLSALAAAVLAGQRRIFFTPDRFAGPRRLRWIRPLLDRSDAIMICPTFVQQRLAVSKGIHPDRCQVIQPGVDFGSIRSRRNAALRQQLGYSSSDFVLFALENRID